MDKYNRNYSLVVEQRDGDLLTIKLPFTIEFDIQRNILTSANVCSVRVYNLSQNHRNLIRKDEFDWGTFRSISLKAGYGESNLTLIFDGNINKAWSTRQGTDTITQIECYDGGFAFVNGITNQPYPEGTTRASVIGDLISKLPHVTLGAVGKFDQKLTRGLSYGGNTVEILNEISDGSFFVDNGKAYCLSDTECVEGTIGVINSKSGLIGTPVLEQTFLHFDMLFEPGLMIGQKVLLDSATAANYNGEYKVISLSHKATISTAVCGDAITTVGLAYGIGELQVVG